MCIYDVPQTKHLNKPMAYLPINHRLTIDSYRLVRSTTKRIKQIRHLRNHPRTIIMRQTTLITFPIFKDNKTIQQISIVTYKIDI